MTCQLAETRNWDIFHVDLKTAFLEGESYDSSTDVICQLPPEAGYPPYIGARLKKAGLWLERCAAPLVEST